MLPFCRRIGHFGPMRFYLQPSVRNTLTFFRQLVAVGILLWAPAYLVSWLSHWVPAYHAWWVTGAGLVFAYLLAAGLALLFVALLVKSRGRGLMAFLLLLSVPMCGDHWLPGLPTPEANRSAGSLRVIQFNAMGLSGFDPTNNQFKDARKAFERTVSSYQPDIMCFQEFVDIDGERINSNLAFLRDTLGFKHVVFQPYLQERAPWGFMRQGACIASKLPIQSRSAMAIPGRQYPEYLLMADIVIGGQTVRIATAHLRSMHLRTPPDYTHLHIGQQEEFAAIKSDSRWRKLAYYLPYHAHQADAIAQELDASPYPVVFCGDLNSLPSSYAYRRIRGSRRDAHVTQTSGFGKTFLHTRQPHIRIDYVFIPAQWQVKKGMTMELSISDHTALLADLQWPALKK